MKDNDCGVRKDNKAKEAHLLKDLRHLSLKTYQRLLKLNSGLALEATQVFFTRETLMTESDYKQFRQNAADAVQDLREICNSGQLRLDLDLEVHFLNQQVPASCD